MHIKMFWKTNMFSYFSKGVSKSLELKRQDIRKGENLEAFFSLMQAFTFFTSIFIDSFKLINLKKVGKAFW